MLAVIVGGGLRTTPAAARASAKARMICADEAQEDLTGVLAVQAKVSSPTWRNRTYSCTYRYPRGSFDISVTEYPHIAGAVAEFARQVAAPTVAEPSLGLADGAFLRQDGSIVVRTDRRFFEVDPTRLPAEFAKLGLDRAAVAQAVATTILKCWKG